MAGPSYEEYLSLTKKEEEQAPVYEQVEPTLEEQTNTGMLYDVAEKLKYLDNIRSKAFAVTAGPVFDLAQGKDPSVAIKKEFESLEPQGQSSFAGRFREIFPDQKPLMDTPVQDIVQGEHVKGMAKQWAQKEFPRTYETLSSVVPSDIPGSALDMVTGELALKKIPQSGIVNTLDDAASVNREKGLTRVMDSNQDRAKVNTEQVNNQKIKIVGDTLEKYGVANEIKDPEKLHNILSGEPGTEFDQFGRQRSTKGKGLINEISDSVRSSAEYFTYKLGNVDISKMADDIVKKLSGEAGDKNSLVPFSDESHVKLSNDLQSRLKIGQEGTSRSFQDLIDMKRNAADAIYEIKNNPQTYGIQGVTDLKVNKAIWDWVDDHITNLGKTGDNDVGQFILANSELSDLLTAKDITAGAKTNNMLGASLAEAAMMAGGGLAVGDALGHPIVGASIGGGLGAARSLSRDMGSQLPSRIANVQQAAADFLRPSQGLKSLSPLTSAGVVANIPDMQQQMLMRRGVVENLADYEIPRTAREILANRQTVLAKIAQATNDPNIVNVLGDALNKHPDKLSAIMPSLIMNPQFQNIFRANKYQTWVDGKILDPMERQKAYNEVNNRADLSNTQKIMLQDGLNRDGSFPESF